MAEQKNLAGSTNFKEAVCIDVGRVYDSCCDRDCLEDLRCFFTPRGQEIIEQALSVRVRNAEVINVFIDVEPVSFNRGFFSCDITFFFLIECDVTLERGEKPVCVTGVSVFNKKVVLFGSEGAVKTFCSKRVECDCECADMDADTTVNVSPKCCVQAVDPIVLDSNFVEHRDRCECCDCDRGMSENILRRFKPFCRSFFVL